MKSPFRAFPVILTTTFMLWLLFHIYLVCCVQGFFWKQNIIIHLLVSFVFVFFLYAHKYTAKCFKIKIIHLNSVLSKPSCCSHEFPSNKPNFSVRIWVSVCRTTRREKKPFHFLRIFLTWHINTLAKSQLSPCSHHDIHPRLCNSIPQFSLPLKNPREQRNDWCIWIRCTVRA